MVSSKKITILTALFFSGCSSGEVVSDKQYCVLSSFNEIVLETNSKEEAYETAHNLTLLGRVFSSKPIYFVKEKNANR